MADIHRRFTLSEERCDGYGDYYARIYAAAEHGKIVYRQYDMGEVPLSAATLLEHADEMALKQPSDPSRRSPFPIAAVVLKQCWNHDTASIVEMVERAIVAPRDYQVFTINAIKTALDAQEDIDGTVTFASRVRGLYINHGSRPIVDDTDFVDIHYLPRADYDGVERNHTGIYVDRGGASYPVRFGLLGSEQLVYLPNPDLV